jgi:hypothetical protein
VTETWDPEAWTSASWAADKALEVPGGLMSFSSGSRGQPTREQRHLYMAAVAFTYAVWENYVEELAIELSEVLARDLTPDRVPPEVQKLITADATPWQLSVDPGWRGLWTQRVRTLAKGDDSTKWGLNTASANNVRSLLGAAGLADALPDFIEPPKSDAGKAFTTPTGTGLTKAGMLNVHAVLSKLIGVRGEAVHTASTSDKLLKQEVLWWANFVEGLYHETDKRARAICAKILND